MSKITELQAAQKRYEEALAKLEKPHSVCIDLEVEHRCCIVFTPQANTLEICWDNQSISLNLVLGQQLLTALKELYE